VRPPGCGSLGGPAPAVPAPAGARSCRSTATAIADPRVSLVRPTPRDLGVASGPPLSRGQALANRRLAPRPRPPNPLRRACPREGGGLILRQFPQTAPDRAWRHAGRHRHRGNATISDGKRLRRGDQATTPFIKKGRHRQKPLSNGLDIDHNYHIWYEKMVVSSIFTLSEVDSIISGRALILETLRARTSRMASVTGVKVTDLTAAGASDDGEHVWITHRLGDGNEYPLVYPYEAVGYLITVLTDAARSASRRRVARNPQEAAEGLHSNVI